MAVSQNVRKERRSDLLEALHGIGAPLLAAQQRLLGRSVTKVRHRAARSAERLLTANATALSPQVAALFASRAATHRA